MPVIKNQLLKPKAMDNNNTLKIVPYKAEYASYFEKFNKAWLEEFFVVEPIDKYVLENCEEAILSKGGKIFFAEYEGKIIGTVALMYVEPGVVELTKMAVDKNYRNVGAGKLLCRTGMEEAGKMDADKVMLYSNRKLEAAIGIYRKLGFLEIPLGKGTYQRADIKMEHVFKK
jgi:ribosomal protein S18 acetylase RimI-like enzyme